MMRTFSLRQACAQTCRKVHAYCRDPKGKRANVQSARLALFERAPKRACGLCRVGARLPASRVPRRRWRGFDTTSQ